MVRLFCAIVGVAGSAFSVQVDESDSVDGLKDAIKAKKPDTIKGIADKLQLYLAKTNDGTWLVSTSKDVMKLKKGEKSIVVKDLMSEEKELQGKSGLQSVLASMPKPSTDQIHVLVVIPKQERALTRLWLATGSIENAFYNEDIRPHLFWIATFRVGHYDPLRCTRDKNVAFWYEGTKLCIQVLFETNDDALHFENDLRDGPITNNSPMYGHFITIRIAKVFRLSAELQRMFYTDCDPKDLKVALLDEVEYQRIEHKRFFVLYGMAEKCYLVPKKLSRDHKRECAKYNRDSNNWLALSREMHGWYAGLSAEYLIVNMLPGSVDKKPTIGKRRKVEVFVEVVGAQYIDRVFSRLKKGSTKTDDPLVMKTFVYVENPETFCFCMKWKHDDNEKFRRRFYDLTPAADYIQ